MGASPEDAAREFVRCLIHTHRGLSKQNGFPHAELIDAAVGCAGSLDSVIRQCNCSPDYAEVFRYCSRRDGNRVEVVRDFLNYMRNRYFDQFRHRLVGNGAFPNAAAFDAYRNRVFALTNPRISRMAEQIAANPRKPIRCQARTDEERAADETFIFGASLLSVSAEAIG